MTLPKSPPKWKINSPPPLWSKKTLKKIHPGPPRIQPIVLHVVRRVPGRIFFGKFRYSTGRRTDRGQIQNRPLEGAIIAKNVPLSEITEGEIKRRTTLFFQRIPVREHVVGGRKETEGEGGATMETINTEDEKCHDDYRIQKMIQNARTIRGEGPTTEFETGLL